MNEGWDNGATTFDCQWKNMDIGARTKKLAFCRAIMCQSGTSCLTAYCCFSELALYKSN
jgi:hypothetical protein